MTMRDTISVFKAGGERELFSEKKLVRSLRLAGASENAADAILDHVRKELQEGMSTTQIYRHALSLLRRIENPPVAARYSLRRAVFGLGPSGFPFEDYVAELFRARGYTVEVGVEVQGHCARHEVDLLAFNDKERLGIELKFHNSPGLKSDLKVALYVKERFEDIKRAVQKGSSEPLIDHGMLITNTKFTTSAIDYSRCAGLRLLGWNYPSKDHLEDLIYKTGIYPVTTLTSLNQREKIALLASNVVICNDLEHRVSDLEKVGVPREKIGTVLTESQALCAFHNQIE